MSWSKGERAENYVAGRLALNGWTIAARNYRRRGFELDIIACKSDRLLCIEVKARQHRRHNDHYLLLNPRKVRRLHQGMRSWLQGLESHETRNTEFWLCLVALSENARERRVTWMRLDEACSKNN